MLRHFVLFAILATVTLFAQEAPPPASQFSEEIEVRVIDVDVVVTDRQGNPLTTLGRDDFELYENGRRIDIGYFSRTVGGRLADVPSPPPDAAPAEPPRIPVTWIVYVDHTNMAPQMRNQAMRQLQTFLERALARGDRGTIALNDGRSFRIQQGITGDAPLLLKTLAKMEREPMSISPTRRRAGIILGQMRRSEAEMGVPSGGRGFVARDETEFMAQTAGGEIEALMHEEAQRTKAAILAVGALLDAVAQLQGRIALVYVGAGFNSLPAGDLAAIWRSRYETLGRTTFEPRPEEEREPIEREITRLYDNLSALRVTVYTIHGGEPGGGVTSVEDKGTTEIAMVTSSDLVAQTETASAHEMARRTGGMFFKVNPALAGQLDAVIRDFDDYYSLGYRPEGDPASTRRIEVKVKVDGARVRHRQTVRERTRAEAAAGAVVASMLQPRPRAVRRVAAPLIPPAVATAANPLGVSVEATMPRRDWPLLSFTFSLRLETLAFVREAGGHRARLVMHFALVAPDGAIYPLESRAQTLTVPASEAAAAAELSPTAEQLVAYSWHLDVSPLKIPENVPAWQKGMQLSVTVEDLIGGTRSIVTVPLERGTR